MATDCIVQKLKGSVQNDNLLPLGYQKATLDFRNSQSILQFRLRWDVYNNVKLTGNAYFTDSTGAENYGQSKTYPGNANNFIYVKDNSAEVVDILFPIYNLQKFNTGSDEVDSRLAVDIAAFKYSKADTINSYFEGSQSIVGVLPDTLNTIVAFGNGYVKASTDELAAYPGFKDLRLSGMDITGDIASLATLTNLNIFRPNGARTTNTVYGEINDMVRGMIANGRSTGSIAMRFYLNGLIKLAGNNLTDKDVSVTITSSTQYTVTNGSNSYTYVKSGDDWVLQ